MARILLLEDDDAIREAVTGYLEHAGHAVTACADGDSAVARSDGGRVDLCVLDVSVPGRSGFEVATEMRAAGPVPVLFLTSRDDEASRIEGFELGADDYVVKPFSPRELVLRVEAILRRTAGTGAQRTGPRRWVSGEARLELDLPARHLSVDGEPRTLTATEWRILTALLEAAPGVVTRPAIGESVLGYSGEVESRATDTHMKNLRAKLGPGAWIETVRGIGFRFLGEAES
jgi:DNA-binding response OmpR family regulator